MRTVAITSAAWAALIVGTTIQKGRNLTPEHIENHGYISYDFDNDGSVDALGYDTNSNFAYAKPSVEDDRVQKVTRKLTPKMADTATAYAKMRCENSTL